MARVEWSLFSWLILAGLVVAQAAPARTGWSWYSEFAVAQTGTVRVQIGPEIVDRSLPGLEDLRLVDGHGHEIPFAVEMPRHRSGHLQNLSESQVAQATPEMTRIQFESGTAQALDAITLDTPVDSFVKAASVFGHRKAGDWMLLAQGHQIFSHGSSRNLRIGFARGQWDRLRVDLRDSASSPPIPIAGVKIHLAAVEELPVQPFELKIVDRLELGDSSRLRIRLPYRNLYVLRLELQTPTPAFKRKLQLHERQISGDRILMQKLDESVISRLLGEEGASDKPSDPEKRDFSRCRKRCRRSAGD